MRSMAEGAQESPSLSVGLQEKGLMNEVNQRNACFFFFCSLPSATIKGSLKIIPNI